MVAASINSRIHLLLYEYTNVNVLIMDGWNVHS